MKVLDRLVVQGVIREIDVNGDTVKEYQTNNIVVFKGTPGNQNVWALIDKEISKLQ